MLLNLLRGASTDGLGAMRPGPRHPILGLRRAETHSLCSALGLRPVTDLTNSDPAYLRNRVRHELLPMLCEMAGRDVVPILARQARLLAEDAALLGELAAAIDPADARRLAKAPGPLARRAVREWLREGHPPDLGDRREGIGGGRRSGPRDRHRRGQERPPLQGRLAPRSATGTRRRSIAG